MPGTGAMSTLHGDAAAAQADTVALPVVLCVDDEPNILSSLRRLFRGRGYQVLTSTSGEAALAQMREQHIDLVISDMRMPEMNGAQFLEAVTGVAEDDTLAADRVRRHFFDSRCNKPR